MAPPEMSRHAIAAPEVNSRPHSGWLDFALKGRKQKHTVFALPSSETIAIGDGFLKTKRTLLKNALASAPVQVVKAVPPGPFQLIIKAQLEDKHSCKQNADKKVKHGRGMRLAGDGYAERPQRNRALEHKADAYMAQFKL
jgi:hypothetical protein